MAAIHNLEAGTRSGPSPREAGAAGWCGASLQPSPLHAPRGGRFGGGTGPPALDDLTGFRILVVEDDPDARELVTAVLENAGAVVESAASVAEGFAALRWFHPELLVSDIAMPDEDGYSLMRRVRALGAQEGGAVPAIALSAFTRPEDRTKALNAGFSLHLGKPVLPADLVCAARRLVAADSFPRA